MPPPSSPYVLPSWTTLISRTPTRRLSSRKTTTAISRQNSLATTSSPKMSFLIIGRSRRMETLTLWVSWPWFSNNFFQPVCPLLASPSLNVWLFFNQSPHLSVRPSFQLMFCEACIWSPSKYLISFQQFLFVCIFSWRTWTLRSCSCASLPWIPWWSGRSRSCGSATPPSGNPSWMQWMLRSEDNRTFEGSSIPSLPKASSKLLSQQENKDHHVVLT